jgi:hypothetical protein
LVLPQIGPLAVCTVVPEEHAGFDESAVDGRGALLLDEGVLDEGVLVDVAAAAVPVRVNDTVIATTMTPT